MSAEPTIPRPFWKTYEVGLVPGPTMVPPEVAAAFSINFGSSDLESEFFDYYVHMQRKIQALLHTSNEIVFMSGEAMVTLWGALKSVLKPGDKVLCVGQGTFLPIFQPTSALFSALTILLWCAIRSVRRRIWRHGESGRCHGVRGEF